MPFPWKFYFGMWRRGIETRQDDGRGIKQISPLHRRRRCGSIGSRQANAKGTRGERDARVFAEVAKVEGCEVRRRIRAKTVPRGGD